LALDRTSQQDNNCKVVQWVTNQWGFVLQLGYLYMYSEYQIDKEYQMKYYGGIATDGKHMER
jgi:hypothetical protein